MISNKYKNLTIDEFKLICFNGSIGDYGDYIGINVKSVSDWIKGYKQVEVPKTLPIRDLFIQPKQKFSNPSLSNIEEPYISKKVFN